MLAEFPPVEKETWLKKADLELGVPVHTNQFAISNNQ